MKKIVIVTGNIGIGGLEKMVLSIANFFASRKYNVFIVCLFGNGNDYKIASNINVINYSKKNSIFRKRIKIFGWIIFLRRIFNEISPDIILCMALKIACLSVLASERKLNRRIVFREMCDPKSKSRSRVVDFLCCKIVENRLSAIIFQTNWEKQCYSKKMQDKGVVIPNPCSYYDSSTEKNEFVVTTGRLLNKQKKHDVLIKSFNLVVKKYPTYILRIFGEGKDRKKDEKLIRKLNLTNNVFLMGTYKDIVKDITSACCFVLSSEYEGMSNSLLEAFLSGVPCVSTNWNGVEDIITNNINGVIVKKNSPKDMAQAIIKIIENKEFACAIANNATKERYKYEYNQILEKYVKIIEG